jgi:3-methylcrotonyl-CoA carboxylase alpha subunit
VTEEVTGYDLVELQLRVASGGSVPEQSEISLCGWAMEARLYAEDPASGFLPSIGPLERLELPADRLRVDTGVEEGGEVSLHYDPMIAKLISRGSTRDEAIESLIAGLDAPLVVHPVKTNAGFLRRCLDHEDFRAARVDTRFIDDRIETLAPKGPSVLSQSVAALAFADGGMLNTLAHGDPWAIKDGFRPNAAPVIETGLDHDGERVSAALTFKGGSVTAEIGDTRLTVMGAAYDATGHVSGHVDGSPVSAVFEPRGREVLVSVRGETQLIERYNPAALADALDGGGAVKAPMPGKVLAVPVAAGDTVTKGQTLAVLEAMKMEHALTAPRDGVVETVTVEAGAQVGDGDVLVTLSEA